MAERREDRARLEALTNATADVRPSDGLTDAVMARIAGAHEHDEVDARLASLERATDVLEPTAAIADAVLAAVLADENDGQKSGEALASEKIFENARRSTASMELCPGFTSALMDRLPSAVSSRRSRWTVTDIVTRSGRAALFAAAAVAVVSVIFSTYAERRLDADVVSSVDPVEVTE